MPGRRHHPNAHRRSAGRSGSVRSARRFLGLSALLTVIIGGVAMLLTIRRYAARQLDQVAVMRCLGSTNGRSSASSSGNWWAWG